MRHNQQQKRRWAIWSVGTLVLLMGGVGGFWYLLLPTPEPAGILRGSGRIEGTEVTMGLIIPPDFSQRLQQGREAGVQVLLDGSNSNTATIALGYITRIIDRYNQEKQMAWFGITTKTGKFLPLVDPQLRIWYNADLQFVYFMVLSMIALAGMMVGVIHPIRGSLILFFLLSVLFLLSSTGIGVLIATVAHTLQQALLLAFFGLLPIMFLSGTLVPIESMPLPLQYLSYLSPLHHYMDVLLGIFLKGVGLETFWKQVVIMSGLGTIILGLSIHRL